MVVWLVRPLAAPGIPRSLRSRPFRRTKGAEWVLTVVVWCLDCQPVVVAEGFEDLFLLLSERHAEALGDGPVGLVSPLGAFAWCGGVRGIVGWILTMGGWRPCRG